MWSSCARDLVVPLRVENHAHGLAWLNYQPVIELGGITIPRLAVLVNSHAEELRDSVGEIVKIDRVSCVDGDRGASETSAGQADVGIKKDGPEEESADDCQDCQEKQSSAQLAHERSLFSFGKCPEEDQQPECKRADDQERTDTQRLHLEEEGWGLSLEVPDGQDGECACANEQKDYQPGDSPILGASPLVPIVLGIQALEVARVILIVRMVGIVGTVLRILALRVIWVKHRCTLSRPCGTLHVPMTSSRMSAHCESCALCELPQTRPTQLAGSSLLAKILRCIASFKCAEKLILKPLVPVSRLPSSFSRF